MASSGQLLGPAKLPGGGLPQRLLGRVTAGGSGRDRREREDREIGAWVMGVNGGYQEQRETGKSVRRRGRGSGAVPRACRPGNRPLHQESGERLSRRPNESTGGAASVWTGTDVRDREIGAAVRDTSWAASTVGGRAGNRCCLESGGQVRSRGKSGKPCTGEDPKAWVSGGPQSSCWT